MTLYWGLHVLLKIFLLSCIFYLLEFILKVDFYQPKPWQDSRPTSSQLSCSWTRSSSARDHPSTWWHSHSSTYRNNLRLTRLSWTECINVLLLWCIVALRITILSISHYSFCTCSLVSIYYCVALSISSLSVTF